VAKYLKYILCAALCLFFASCGSQNIRHNVRHLPKGAAIAVVMNASEEYVDKARTLFILSGYSVKAISAFKDEDAYDSKRSAGLLRLDLYNSEIVKAANLRDVKNNLKANYLVVLELKRTRMSWGRVIDLRTGEVIFISNYTSASPGENVEPIITYFISSMKGE